MEILETIKQVVLEANRARRTGVNMGKRTTGAVGAAIHRPVKRGSKLGKAASPFYANKLHRKAKQRIVQAIEKIAKTRQVQFHNAQDDQKMQYKLQSAQHKAEMYR